WFFDVPANFTWNQSSWNHYCIVTTGYGINDKKIYVNGVEMPINPSWSFIHPSLTLFDRNAIISNHLSTYPCLYDNLAISNEALTPAAVAHIASNPEISLTTASGAYTSTFANSWNGKVDFEQANYVIDTNGHKIISTDIYGTYIHNLSYSDINLSSDTV
ncbi:MAG: hypothetical protein H8E74_01980, partial [Gammaproteobacteria bacterium]|nr:hypothetical protein [Gammaproteobacteria bacterium]